MQNISFTDLPAPAKFSVMLSFFLGWVIFAEVVIDRQGWAAYLPFYRVGNLCPYDVAVILILFSWWLMQERAAAQADAAREATKKSKPPMGACC